MFGCLTIMNLLCEFWERKRSKTKDGKAKIYTQEIFHFVTTGATQDGDEGRKKIDGNACSF